MSKRTARDLTFLIGAITISFNAAALTANSDDAAWAAAKSPNPSAATRPTNPLNAERAFNYLKEMCAFGPRPSGSAAMLNQQAYLKQHFEKLSGKVTFQRFLAN